jgi:hypothetical protein
MLRNYAMVNNASQTAGSSSDAASSSTPHIGSWKFAPSHQPVASKQWQSASRIPVHSESILCIHCIKETAKFARKMVYDKLVSMVASENTSTGANSSQTSVQRECYIEMKHTIADPSKPAAFHVIIGDMPIIDAGMIAQVSEMFDNSASITNSSIVCTANSGKPSVYLDGCIVRTFMAELYDSETMPISAIFIFSMHPTKQKAAPTESLMSNMPRICKFSVKMTHWTSAAFNASSVRRRASEELGLEACKGASIKIARDMTEAMFTTVAGRKIIRPQSIKVFSTSKSMAYNDKKNACVSIDAEVSESIRKRVICCDVVFKVSCRMPLYVYTLLSNWSAERRGFSNRIDPRWKMVSLFSERPNISGGSHRDGTCFVGLIFVSDAASEFSNNSENKRQSIPLDTRSKRARSNYM